MSAPHAECGSVGKFDCHFDEGVHGFTMESGAGEGHVDSPVGWFEEITLETECKGHEQVVGSDLSCDGSCTPEWLFHQHYGTRWLIARENDRGFFWTEAYETEAYRDERLEALREAYAEWDTGVLS